MKTMNFDRPAFCLTLPVNTSRYSSVYKNYIKEGKWDEVEASSPFYSMAVEEYLACKQAGITCEIKSIPRPKTERGKKNLEMILNRLGAAESDLWVPELEDKSVDAAKLKVAKKEFEEALKAPITQEEREMSDIISKIVATEDKETIKEMKKMSKLLGITVPNLFIVAIRAGELGCTHEEAIAMYRLSKKFTDLANIAEIFKSYVLGDEDPDEFAAILSQAQIDLFNAMSKESSISDEDLKLAELALQKDYVDKLRNKPIIVADTTATEQHETEQTDQSKLEQKPDQNATEKPASKAPDQDKKNEQKKPDQKKQPEQEKEPAVQVDSNSAPGQKPEQAAPDPDRVNGFVNNNIPVINKYAGCIDVVNFAKSLGYTTKLVDRGDGFITAEIFAAGVTDPISKLVVDPGNLYPPVLGYAILVPDGGKATAPAYSDIVMSDYIYINDATERSTLSLLVTGLPIPDDKMEEIKTVCNEGKALNCIIDHRSIPAGISPKQQYMLGEFAKAMFDKKIRVRGSIKESADEEIKVEFATNLGNISRYYQNGKYGKFTAMVTVDKDDKVSVSIVGNKKAAKLKETFGAAN